MSEALLAQPPVTNPAAGMAGRILVIDDEASIRESLQTLLEMEGFSIETANDGEEGLRKLERQTYDLVLLDLALPGRDGIEILRDIHARLPSLPVIILTAKSDPADRFWAFQSGTDAFLNKPIDPEILEEI